MDRIDLNTNDKNIKQHVPNIENFFKPKSVRQTTATKLHVSSNESNDTNNLFRIFYDYLSEPKLKLNRWWSFKSCCHRPKKSTCTHGRVLEIYE